MSNQDSLLLASVSKPGFSIPKNLIVVGGVILIIVVIVVFAYQSATGDIKPTAVTPKATADLYSKPGIEVVEKIAFDQTTVGKEEAKSNGKSNPKPTPMNGADLPEMGDDGSIVLPSVPASQNMSKEQKSAVAARDLTIRESSIFAFNDSGSGVEDTIKKAMGGEDSASPVAQQEAVLQSAIQSMQSMQAGNQKPNEKGSAEKNWMAENASLEGSRKVIRGYAPNSKYTLMQGKVINAVLKTSINSDLPGEIIASVLIDVYDSIEGRHLLIPKGSTLVGVYNSDIRIGQERVNMAFKRLILPNGISVDLGGNVAMDSGGSSGIGGSVNNHYGQMFLISTMTAIGAFATERNTSSSGTTVNTSPQTSAAGQIFIEMNKNVMDRNRAMAPTITIPSGVRFLVNVANDIELPPYKR